MLFEPVVPIPDLPKLSDFPPVIQYAGCGACGTILINDSGTTGYGIRCPVCRNGVVMLNDMDYERIKTWIDSIRRT
jgi:DNA-directed RNA polymerase subunit RPC12/RpoP